MEDICSDGDVPVLQDELEYTFCGGDFGSPMEESKHSSPHSEHNLENAENPISSPIQGDDGDTLVSEISDSEMSEWEDFESRYEEWSTYNEEQEECASDQERLDEFEAIMSASEHGKLWDSSKLASP